MPCETRPTESGPLRATTLADPPADIAAETIAAAATAAGQGAIGILRLSGPAAARITRALLRRELPPPRRAALCSFHDRTGEPIDQGLVLYFPAPKSYTGEDLIELHAHGSPVVLDRLLAECCAQGARLAGPGEFSLRAFEHGRLDLLQAEAVADLIAAGSEEAARAAQRSLSGAFSARVAPLREALIRLRVQVEAAIDFPGEELELAPLARLAGELQTLTGQLAALRAAAHQGQRLRDGLRIAILGPPNAGKSSLLNHLTHTETAIVSPVPGTTRDLLREHVVLDGLILRFTDTAGLRDSADPIEQEGVRRARTEAASADLILWVEDAAAVLHAPPAFHAKTPLLRVRNKVDLTDEPAGPDAADPGLVRVSVLTGAGIEALIAILRVHAGQQALPEGSVFLARRRHVDALAQAQDHIAGATDHLPAADFELLAEELRLAQRALEELTGEHSTEELLGRIFSEFCIGK